MPVFTTAPLFMPEPRVEPVSSSEVKVTWLAPDPVSEVRGDVKMYQVIMVKNNTGILEHAPPIQNLVSLHIYL